MGPSFYPTFTNDRGKERLDPEEPLPFGVIMLWNPFSGIRRVSRVWLSDIGMSGYGR
jgi:hypothetical protein